MLPMFMNSAARMNSGTARMHVVGVHAVEQLLGGRSHVLPGEQQIEDRPAIIEWPIGSPRKARRDRDERQRERACKVHTPELALVGSNSSGATPRMACQASQI